jgi:hypothetical protein
MAHDGAVRRSIAVKVRMPDTVSMLAMAQRFRRNAQAASLPGCANLMVVAAEVLEAAIRNQVATPADREAPRLYRECLRL